VVKAGVPVTLFLEGTSSDGSSVLPFRSSLLAPIETHHWPATAAWIHYRLPEGEGSVVDEVCYWRDMTFATHFLNLLTKRRVEAFVSFGAPVRERLNRKEMARELHAEVCRLMEARLGKKEGAAPKPAPLWSDEAGDERRRMARDK
jgi:lyso-ornithine lipid O-acyltransferase